MSRMYLNNWAFSVAQMEATKYIDYEFLIFSFFIPFKNEVLKYPTYHILFLKTTQ